MPAVTSAKGLHGRFWAIAMRLKSAMLWPSIYVTQTLAGFCNWVRAVASRRSCLKPRYWDVDYGMNAHWTTFHVIMIFLTWSCRIDIACICLDFSQILTQ